MNVFDNFNREDLAAAILGALVVKYGGEITFTLEEIQDFLQGGESQFVKIEFVDEETIKLELINANQLEEQTGESAN